MYVAFEIDEKLFVNSTSHSLISLPETAEITTHRMEFLISFRLSENLSHLRLVYWLDVVIIDLTKLFIAIIVIISFPTVQRPNLLEKIVIETSDVIVYG